VQCGETLHVTGEWTRHAQHGDQFRVASFRSELPASVYGIRKFLGSGLVPGIGKVYAEKIVDAFGTETLRVLSEESARLRSGPRNRAQTGRRDQVGVGQSARLPRALRLFARPTGSPRASASR
jgi:exodeoxyribonuclease V alpha subunit